jgi:flagella basal body P-ring formation protein FlgA
MTWIVALALSTTCARTLGAGGAELRPAAEAIRAAVLERVGADAVVSLTDLDVPNASVLFRDAHPDPEGRLDKPMRFLLTSGTGATVVAVVSVHVAMDHAIARRAIGRGETLSAADLDTVKDQLQGTPLRRLPIAAQLIGGRVLRPIAAGAIVFSDAVAVRRLIEPGDRVTVVATTGPIEVSAAMIAADGGRVGDLIRAMNPETRRYIRGRILNDGRIEVMYAR